MSIVGREVELRGIADFLDGISEGPAAIVIEGEAGSGKTTLWRAGIEAAHERGFYVLSAGATEAEATWSFAVLGDLLAGVLGEVLGELPEPQRRALEVALLLRVPEGRSPDERAVATAFLAAARTLAQAAPLVVAVDDVQWFDASSISVLTFAARRLAGAPIGFLVTRRVDGRRPSPLGLDRALPPEALVRVDLGPLTLGALHHLFRGRLEQTFPRPVLRRIHELSDGNPFFALEIARGLERRGAGFEPGEPLPLPDELRALMRERLAVLPDSAREALAAIAALGRPSLERLDAVTGPDVERALEPAVSADVIEIVGERIRFTHPLLASTVLADTPPAARRTLHRELAAVAEEPEERARHLALAAAGPDEDAAAALEDAAARTAKRGAIDAAAELYAEARRLTPSQDLDGARRRAIAEAELCSRAGDSPRASALLADVLAASEPGRWRAEALALAAHVHLWGVDWRLAVEFGRRALAEADDTALRARIELGLAYALDLYLEDIPELVVHARAAAALAEEIGDEAILAQALSIHGRAELLLGREGAKELLERALALEHATEGLSAVQHPSEFMAAVYGWTDDFEGAITGLEAAGREALEHGDETALLWIVARLSQWKCLVGDCHEAREQIERAYEIALEAAQSANQAVLLATRALVDAHLGLEGSAREAGEQALELTESVGVTMARRVALWALGLLELSLSRPGEADGYLAPLVAETRAAGIQEPGALRFVPDEVEALVALGRLDEAEALLAWYEARAEAVGRRSALAAAARCRGLLASAHADHETAVGHLERALSMHEGVPLPFERARTLLALGSAQRRAKHKRASRESLDEALTVFEELGAALWVEKTRAELGRIGGRAPSRWELTPTEERVAALVAEGRTNREVAQALFVTAHTVEFHLSRIYGKLGVRSRTELARRLTDSAGKT